MHTHDLSSYESSTIRDAMFSEDLTWLIHELERIHVFNQPFHHYHKKFLIKRMIDEYDMRSRHGLHLIWDLTTPSEVIVTCVSSREDRVAYMLRGNIKNELFLFLDWVKSRSFYIYS